MLVNLDLIDQIIAKAMQHPKKYEIEVGLSCPRVYITRKGNKKDNTEEEEIFNYYKDTQQEDLTMTFNEITHTYIKSFCEEIICAEGHFVNMDGESFKNEDFSKINEKLEEFLNNVL